MGFSESDGICRYHPNQRRVPGVCSSCLRERLNLVSQSRAPYSSAMAESCYSSLSSSSPVYSASSSPNHHRSYSVRHLRNLSDRSALFSLPLGLECDEKGGLRKSRSVAVVPMRRRDAVAAGGKKKKKKGEKNSGGFWKKLLVSTGKKTKEVFMNPIAVRGKV